MPEFGETASEFVRNLIHSLQEEADRLPSPTAMMDSLKEFDPTPEQLGDSGEMCRGCGEGCDGYREGVREASSTFHQPPPDFEVPDDLRDLFG